MTIAIVSDRRAVHINDVTALESKKVGSYVTYFPRADLNAVDTDHAQALLHHLRSVGFEDGSPFPVATGTYQGAETYRYELFRENSSVIVTEYVKPLASGYSAWCHIKLKAPGSLAIEIREFINGYNTKLEEMFQ